MNIICIVIFVTMFLSAICYIDYGAPWLQKSLYTDTIAAILAADSLVKHRFRPPWQWNSSCIAGLRLPWLQNSLCKKRVSATLAVEPIVKPRISATTAAEFQVKHRSGFASWAKRGSLKRRRAAREAVY